MIFRSTKPPEPLSLDDLPDGPEPGTLLARLKDIPDHGGLDVKLTLNQNGGEINILIQRYEGALLVYENRCPHAGTPLNLFDDRFLDTSGHALICRTHGATFDPTDGRCKRGPCKGEYLRAIAVEITDEAIFSA